VPWGIATQRLSVDNRGRVVYRYKQPFRDGSTHVVLEPLDVRFRMNGMPRAQGEGETREPGRETGLGYAQERPSLAWPHWFRIRV